MTITGLEIELDQSGPELMLLVSRYKFADEVQESTEQAEQIHLKSVDAAVNDDRRLDWTDVCGGSSSMNTTASVEASEESASTEKKRGQATSPTDRGRSESFRSSKDFEDAKNETQTQEDEFGDSNSPRSADEADKEEQESPGNSLLSPRNADEAEWSKEYGELTTPPGSAILKKQQQPASKNTFDAQSDNESEIDSEPSDQDSEIGEELPQLNDNGSPFRFHAEESSVAESSPESDLVGKEQGLDEEEDDGNAWYGCVCGKLHSKIPVFWIQCETCRTWYNVSADCVGFSEAAAKYVVNWTCWGCPKLTTTASIPHQQPESESPKPSPDARNQSESSPPSGTKKRSSPAASQPSAAQKKQKPDCSPSDNETKNGDKESMAADNEPIAPFAKNNLVMVKEHA